MKYHEAPLNVAHKKWHESAAFSLCFEQVAPAVCLVKHALQNGTVKLEKKPLIKLLGKLGLDVKGAHRPRLQETPLARRLDSLLACEHNHW